MDNLAVYYQCVHGIERARLGYLYANGQLTATDAFTMIGELQDVACSYALLSIDIGTVMEWAVERWANDEDELRPLAERACQRVYNKWEGGGTDGAAEWALDMVEEYAAEEGIALVEA